MDSLSGSTASCFSPDTVFDTFSCMAAEALVVSIFVDIHPVDKEFSVLKSSWFRLYHGRL